MKKPSLIAHADWSKDSDKRWCAVAILGRDGKYHAKAPEPVGDLDTYFDRLCERADGGGVLAGFDFPIGLPTAYAKRARIKDFREALKIFGRSRWKDFYEPATSIDEISITRPFYPQNPNSAKKGDKDRQSQKLVGTSSELLRFCEDIQPKGERLFWLVGGKQVGKATIKGWKKLISPALEREPPPAVWPFDGSLAGLLERWGIVIAETYPREFYGHLALCSGASGKSKRVWDARVADARALLEWGRKRKNDVELAGPLRKTIKDGFGNDAGGEDRFDAVVGLFGMIDVVMGELPAGNPETEEVRRIEGWILGRQP